MGFFSGNQTTTNTGWSQTEFGAMDPRLTQALGYANFGAGQLANELGYGQMGGGGLPQSLSLAALSENPILQMFGSVDKFKEFLQNPTLTKEQKDQLTTAFMAPYEALQAQQGAAGEAAQGQLRMNVDQLLAGFRESQGGSGVRGSTAGSAGIARALAGLGQGQADFARGMAADRAATGAQAAGGLAGALLEQPYRNQNSMLQGLGALFQQHQNALQTRGLAEDMRRSIFSNPAISALMQERLAGGRTTSYSKSSTPTPGWGSQLLGLGAQAAMAYATGGASMAAPAVGNSFANSQGYSNNGDYSQAYYNWLRG